MSYIRLNPLFRTRVGEPDWSPNPFENWEMIDSTISDLLLDHFPLIFNVSFDCKGTIGNELSDHIKNMIFSHSSARPFQVSARCGIRSMAIAILGNDMVVDLLIKDLIRYFNLLDESGNMRIKLSVRNGISDDNWLFFTTKKSDDLPPNPDDSEISCATKCRTRLSFPYSFGFKV